MEVKIIPTGGHCNRLRAIAMCTKYTIQGMFVPQDDIQRRIDEVKESLKSKYPNRIITLMDAQFLGRNEICSGRFVLSQQDKKNHRQCCFILLTNSSRDWWNRN